VNTDPRTMDTGSKSRSLLHMCVMSKVMTTEVIWPLTPYSILDSSTMEEYDKYENYLGESKNTNFEQLKTLWKISIFSIWVKVLHFTQCLQ